MDMFGLGGVAAGFFGNIALGFGVALSLQNLLLCFIGCLLGTMIGVLPGIGPLTTMAMVLPFTFHLGPTGALIMLSGVFYGAQYGGSTTAILVKIPGETSSVVTILDGHAMAQQGRAGPALAMAAIASLFAGSVVTMLIAAAGPPLASIALLFHSADYVSVMLLGLVSAVVLAHGSVLKAIAMIVLGILFGLVGTDIAKRRLSVDDGRGRAVRRARLRADLDGHLRPRRDHVQHRAPDQGGAHRRHGYRPDADRARTCSRACRR